MSDAVIVYRPQQRQVETSSYLGEVRRSPSRLERSGFRDGECVMEVLIDYGEFETAVADALSTDANIIHPLVTTLRRAGLLTGHLDQDRAPGRVVALL